MNLGNGLSYLGSTRYMNASLQQKFHMKTKRLYFFRLLWFSWMRTLCITFSLANRSIPASWRDRGSLVVKSLYTIYILSTSSNSLRSSYPVIDAREARDFFLNLGNLQLFPSEPSEHWKLYPPNFFLVNLVNLGTQQLSPSEPSWVNLLLKICQLSPSEPRFTSVPPPLTVNY